MLCTFVERGEHCAVLQTNRLWFSLFTSSLPLALTRTAYAPNILPTRTLMWSHLRLTEGILFFFSSHWLLPSDLFHYNHVWYWRTAEQADLHSQRLYWFFPSLYLIEIQLYMKVSENDRESINVWELRVTVDAFWRTQGEDRPFSSFRPAVLWMAQHKPDPPG